MKVILIPKPLVKSVELGFKRQQICGGIQRFAVDDVVELYAADDDTLIGRADVRWVRPFEMGHGIHGTAFYCRVNDVDLAGDGWQALARAEGFADMREFAEYYLRLNPIRGYLVQWGALA